MYAPTSNISTFICDLYEFKLITQGELTTRILTIEFSLLKNFQFI